jgi:hypothetical protein
MAHLISGFWYPSLAPYVAALDDSQKLQALDTFRAGHGDEQTITENEATNILFTAGLLCWGDQRHREEHGSRPSSRAEIDEPLVPRPDHFARENYLRNMVASHSESGVE